MFSAKNIVLLTEINGFFDASLLHNYMDVIEKNIGKSGPYRLPISKERRLSDTQDLDWENKDR